VVDYVGVGRELAKALTVFEKEDLEGIFGVEDIKKELANLDYWYKMTLGFFQSIDRSKGKPENILQKCMEILKPEDVRAEFDASFREFARSMDFLMPDPVVVPYLEDFKFLGTIREGAKNLYRDERLSLKDCSKKVEKLIHAHITASGIESILEPINITAPDFQEKLEIKGSSRAKASHVEYAIRQTITEKVATDPAFYGSLKERLEEIIEEHIKERKDEAQLLKDLLELGNKEKDREIFARSLGLEDAREFSFYGLVIDWTEREDIQKEMRREIKRLLRSKGCPEDKIEPLTREIVSLARIQLKDV
jgi:type I restriction enzyme R subunit